MPTCLWHAANALCRSCYSDIIGESALPGALGNTLHLARAFPVEALVIPSHGCTDQSSHGVIVLLSVMMLRSYR